MTISAHEIHEACIEACNACPQFRCWEDDADMGHYGGYGYFGDIPRMGVIPTIKFWRQIDLLWKMGYSEELPPHIQRLFENIDKYLDLAIKKALKEG